MRLLTGTVRFLPLVVACLATVARGGCADVLIGAAAEEHLWLVAEAPRPANAVRLYHHAVRMNGPGIRAQIELNSVPDTMAAWGDRVWMTFSPEPGAAPGRREVFSTQIRYDRALDLHVLEHADRLQTVAPLPGAGTLAGLVGTADGPVALLVPAQWAAVGVRAEGSAEGIEPDLEAPRLLILRHDDWHDIELPSELTAGAAIWRLVAGGDDGERLTVLRASVDRPRHTRVMTREHDGTWSLGTQTLAIRMIVWQTRLGPQPVLVSELVGEDLLRVELLRSERTLWLADFACPDQAWVLLGMRDGLHLISQDTAGRLVHRTLDAATGKMGSGEKMTPPVSPGRVWYTGLLVATVAALVLVLVMRPGGRAVAITPPDGRTILGLSNRGAALAMDLFPGGVLALMITGCSPGDLLRMPLVAATPEETVPYLLMVGITVAHSLVTEALSGRTLGKALMGAKVISVDGKRVPFGRILLRNLLKLVALAIPPLVVVAVLNPNLQGMGDLAARTVVVGEPPEPAPNDR